MVRLCHQQSAAHAEHLNGPRARVVRVHPVRVDDDLRRVHAPVDEIRQSPTNDLAVVKLDKAIDGIQPLALNTKKPTV
ncbi:hypothetical protein ACFQ1S_34330, partial [Kibdelosporangium lantanae]